MKNLLGVADYGMDVWYGGNYNLEQRLLALKECGFDGLEFLRGGDSADAMHNAVTFHKLGMDFASCRMADPEQAMKCACAFGKKYIWFPMRPTRDIPFGDYCRRANDFVKAARYYGLSAGLHNHLGNRVENQQELDDFMAAVPGAELVLDIAHLHAAGGDCVGTIRKYHDRIAAVHFKDVYYKDLSIGLDRWPERLRFCGLGCGNAGMDMEAIARALQDCKYSKWIHIEHDTHLQDPLIDLKNSADLLKSLFE